ncbi:hypothetical protein V8B97DRAFT_1294994 [Scleroderma yunnanense]
MLYARGDISRLTSEKSPRHSFSQSSSSISGVSRQKDTQTTVPRSVTSASSTAVLLYDDVHHERGRQDRHSITSTKQDNDARVHPPTVILNDAIPLSSMTQSAAEAIGSASTTMNQMDTVDSSLSYLRLFNKFAMSFSGVYHILVYPYHYLIRGQIHPYAAIAMAALVTASSVRS